MSDEFSDHHGALLSFDTCEKCAMIIRTRLGLDESQPIPAVSGALVELGFECVVRSAEAMAGQDAFAIPAKQEIHFRQDIFERVLEDEEGARFIGLHEAAHGLVHDGETRYFKLSDGNVLLPFVSDDDSIETQADRIARAALMPMKMVEQCSNSRELAILARVPLAEAVKRLRDIFSRSSRVVPAVVSAGISQLRTDTAASNAARSKALAEETKLRLWNALPFVDREDPTYNRKCEGYWVRWDEFGKSTQCGWFIEGNEVKSWFAFRSR